jgi:hypothetical protein
MNLDPQSALWQIERDFWTTDDRAFYETNLTDDALMAFDAPHGLLGKAQAVQTIQGTPRWQRVELEDCHAIFVSDSVVLLAYRARGWHAEDAEPYTARIVSSYVKRRGRWMLTFHQHTPEALNVRAGTARQAPSS